MKPIVPSIPLTVWRNIYSASDRFHGLRPWDMLDDTDLIGVRDPSSGATSYGVCMGSGGTIFGYCLYRGTEGFDIYRRLMAGTWEPDESFALQNCLKLEFGPRSDLRREDLAIIAQLGLSFKGKHAWPEFRSLLPDYLPWFVSGEEARVLALGLNAMCLHFERVSRGEAAESLRDQECLVYTPSDNSGFDFGWEPYPTQSGKPIYFPAIDPARCDALRARKPKPDSPWEAGVFHLPAEILDRERPYFVRMGVVCQKSSGFVFKGDPYPPEVPAAQLLADSICSSIEEHSFIPRTIFVRDSDVASGLTPLGKALGIEIRCRQTLEGIASLRAAMFEELMGKNERRKK